MKLTYEALLNDPTLMDRLHARARRERAEAVRGLVASGIATLANFFKSNHAARPHLARQG